MINPRINEWWSGWWEPGYVEQGRYLYDHELVAFTSGKSQVLVGEQIFTCSAGDVLIIPPGVLHWTRILNERTERYCFHFDWVQDLPIALPPFVYESSGEYRPRRCKHTPIWLKMKMPLYLTGRPLPDLHSILNKLIKCNTRSPVDMLRQRGLFTQLLAEVIGGGQDEDQSTLSRHGKSLRMVHSLKQRIEKKYCQQLTMHLIAGEYKITPTHMARAFHAFVGMSPLEYMNHLRLEEAYRLLSECSMNISEVASKVGFSDANYFSRLFRKKMGMSPSFVATNVGKEAMPSYLSNSVLSNI